MAANGTDAASQIHELQRQSGSISSKLTTMGFLLPALKIPGIFGHVVIYCNVLQ
jgi:hypothetical protein